MSGATFLLATSDWLLLSSTFYSEEDEDASSVLPVSCQFLAASGTPWGSGRRFL
jgi:hypothetical protein